MTDGDALLKAIIAHPEEDVPRLVYADWLDENGQPERAEFVRVQVTNPAWFTDRDWFDSPIPYPPDYLRALDWLKYGPADDHLSGLIGGSCHGSGGEYVWHRESVQRGGRADGTIRVTWARGFITEVTCSVDWWLARGDAVRAAHPVTAVRLTTLPSVGQIQRAGGFTFDGTDWPPSRFLVRRWPGVTFELPAPAHATA